MSLLQRISPQSKLKNVAGASAEYLVYDYSHEKDGEWLNTASSYQFPTYKFITKQKLTRIPRTLAFRSQDGKVASINLNQGNEEGRSHLFYINLNELKKYAKGKVLMTFCWGEKELDVSYYHQKDSWFLKLRREGRNYWKKIFVQSL